MLAIGHDTEEAHHTSKGRTHDKSRRQLTRIMKGVALIRDPKLDNLLCRIAVLPGELVDRLRSAIEKLKVDETTVIQGVIKNNSQLEQCVL